MSAVEVPDGSDFPLENLPFGVVAFADGREAVVVRIGDDVVDLASAGIEPELCATSSLNALMASGKGPEVRRRAGELLASGGADRWLEPVADVTCRLPVAVGDYVDFYASLDHATNVGRLFRPGGDPLPGNWRQLPIGYHGRAGSVVVSGTPVVRPHGLVADGEQPARLRASGALDFELEVGFIVATPGRAIAPDAADRHVFGAVLLNDWSARDIQAFESQPLGPHLAKSFATTISPWVVTLEALAPHLVAPPAQEPAPEPYLAATRPWGLELELEAALDGERITSVSFASMYWTFAQQLAHLTVNGAGVRTGDLFASGTVSGPGPGELGCLLEATRNGAAPLRLADGRARAYLADGDVVELSGHAGGKTTARIGFGTCAGTVVPAVKAGG